MGLPNVGKSTLFNSITQSNAEAANYAFCTIEPNKGVALVPDERLSVLSAIHRSKKTIQTTIEFIDIAGLVAGAHKGEGLGNQFLGHIREVDAICHIVRVFEDARVIRAGESNPIENIETIHTELILADLTTIEKRHDAVTKQARSGDKQAIETLNFLDDLSEKLSQGQLYRSLDTDRLSPQQRQWLKELHLITAKPHLIVANLDEAKIKTYEEEASYRELKTYCRENVYPLVSLSATMEKALSEMNKEEAEEILDSEAIGRSGVQRLTSACYELLNLITFFTSGEKETRAWTVEGGAKAPQAAGKIHSDFEQGFIRAETVAYEDMKEWKSYVKCREAGKVRMEGKDYIVRDGDIFVFHFQPSK